MKYPELRLQRLRQTQSVRQWVNETHLNKTDFIMPLFISESITHLHEVPSLPGVMQHTLDSMLSEVEEIAAAGITSVLLFGIPKSKDEEGSQAYNANGIVQKAIRAIKQRFPQMIVIADCCLCAYTRNGHCGIMENGVLDNDRTLTTLGKVAASYANAGVDIVAPSGMMDGQVQAIRKSLDQAGKPMAAILSYAVKYASSLYGPFRQASGSGEHFDGDRKHHQLAPGQAREALREAQLDIQEGADMLMIKPALFYQDMIWRVRQETLLPIVAYNVSGEYSMLKMAAQAGLFDEKDIFREAFLGLKRAGADLIISYYAKEMARGLA